MGVDVRTGAQAEGNRLCGSCLGSGEVGSDYGPTPCPDCAGSGYLPSPDVLVEWRICDVERRYAFARTSAEQSRDDGLSDELASDVRWLIAELRRARRALTDIVSLVQDAEHDEGPLAQVGHLANRALALYAVVDATDSPAGGASPPGEPTKSR